MPSVYQMNVTININTLVGFPEVLGFYISGNRTIRPRATFYTTHATHLDPVGQQ